MRRTPNFSHKRELPRAAPLPFHCIPFPRLSSPPSPSLSTTRPTATPTSSSCGGLRPDPTATASPSGLSAACQLCLGRSCARAHNFCSSPTDASSLRCDSCNRQLVLDASWNTLVGEPLFISTTALLWVVWASQIPQWSRRRILVPCAFSASSPLGLKKAAKAVIWRPELAYLRGVWRSWRD